MVELDDEKVFYAFDKTLEPAMVVPSGRRCAFARRTASATRFKSPKTSSMESTGIIPIRLRAPSSWRGRFRAARSKADAVGAIEFDQQVGFLHGRKRGRLR